MLPVLCRARSFDQGVLGNQPAVRTRELAQGVERMLGSHDFLKTFATVGVPQSR